MPVPPCGRAERRVGNAGTEVGVWSPLGVVSDPLQQNGPKMALIQQNQPIQTLTTDCADQSLAEGVRLRRPHGSLEHAPPIAVIARSTPAA